MKNDRQVKDLSMLRRVCKRGIEKEPVHGVRAFKRFARREETVSFGRVKKAYFQLGGESKERT